MAPNPFSKVFPIPVNTFPISQPKESHVPLVPGLFLQFENVNTSCEAATCGTR